MSFDYNSGPIEVFIVSNDEKGVNGYAEVSAVVHLLSPYTRITTTQLWNTVHASYKVQNNGKNFIHAIAICKFLSAIPENDSASYLSLRQLVRDLIVGDQRELDDETKRELVEIKEVLSDTRRIVEQSSNTMLGDFNGLLQILKSEILCDLKESLSSCVDSLCGRSSGNEFKIDIESSEREVMYGIESNNSGGSENGTGNNVSK
ncbi:ORF71 P24capsid [Cydia pomonella granulovirus]|uniref:ORF71 P24capsid n=2 Tax=Cydia pomonella granulosis virus TaxID=28289 RepID=Q91EY4_GVCPM|nr:ORF71 P24capsid [Cydia pomonella granulovirus]AAK70731.1 ORF71 P24capsid [Cydia pomonella granulovirus]AIU36717.1 ORF71 p24 capsid [Cydia pomonella granulovirus]AIU36996.1 ORF71 p24 capsid [Cydia pomonella granulovirus]AIU37138.1 ORF71 p24 capsid [Cydia pomonella granulovirus]AIU37278.1 ORF71 p24 capsid [Cydia pomonella granulovirus]